MSFRSRTAPSLTVRPRDPRGALGPSKAPPLAETAAQQALFAERGCLTRGTDQ